MARPLRIEFPGALYHVTNRGNAQAPVFLCDEDRNRFLLLLGHIVDRLQWRCHAYCLMDNHYHLMLETPEPNLSQGMRQLNSVYTQQFNRHHSRVGHLFQGRFKAILVEKDSYLLELARYIVLNPVRAGIVASPADYHWSSYQATAGLKPAPKWLSTNWILQQFNTASDDARSRYMKFVAQGLGAESPWHHTKGQLLLGTDPFIDRMKPLLEEAGDKAEIPRTQRLAHRPDLEELFPHLAKDKHSRDDAIRLAYLKYGYSMAQIARTIGLHYSTVSKIVKGER